MTTPQLINRITELTDVWYKLIAKDHHKDRDCHFYINTVWSYGQRPYYRIEHFGYINDDLTEEYPTYREACESLIEYFTEIINREQVKQLNDN